MRRRAFIACLIASLAPFVETGRAQRATSAAAPVVVIETAKGTIEIQLFPSEAPKSVEHIVALVKKSFYRSQRVHRAEASLVQFGDPQTRDMTRQASWGTGSSFNPIGVAEISKRKHVRGAVGLAHSGNARLADSQIYIMKTPSPSLDGKHAVIGQVVLGMTVVDRLERTDILKVVSLKEAGQK